MSVEWPYRREDVTAAVRWLAQGPGDGVDIGLTNAIHWLIDDTWWDQWDPAASIGTILNDPAEAEQVAGLVELLVGVAERQGPTSPDAAWFGDEAWPAVQEQARLLLLLLDAPSP